MIAPIETQPDHCVFVDTNYLCAVPNKQRAAWDKLLYFSETKKIKIYISFISYEEWRTGIRDDLLATHARLLTALRDFKATPGNPFIKEALEFDKLTKDLFPSPEAIEAASFDSIDKFIEKNKIEIAPLEDRHQNSVWERYFSWQQPFQTGQPHYRDVKSHREGRKSHFPDAFIVEAIRDLNDKGYAVLLLGGDDNLGTACSDLDVTRYQDAQKILDTLNIQSDNLPATPAIPATRIAPADSTQPTTSSTHSPTVAHVTSMSAPDTETQAQATGSVPSGTELDIVVAALTAFDQIERDLQIKVLGSVNVLAPLSKQSLFELLGRQGFTPDQIRNVAERLCFASLLEDTGNAYLPKNDAVCRAAGSLIINELGEALDVI